MYYSLCAANDVFGSNTQLRNERHRLQKARDFLFSSLAFPNSLVIELNIIIRKFLCLAF